MRMRTNDIDSRSFCVNIMIERKQVPEIDFVIASLRQKTFESYLSLSLCSFETELLSKYLLILRQL